PKRGRQQEQAAAGGRGMRTASPLVKSAPERATMSLARGICPSTQGEVSERSKERDWKSRTGRKVRRGFKSRPLRRHGANQVSPVGPLLLRSSFPAALALPPG